MTFVVLLSRKFITHHKIARYCGNVTVLLLYVIMVKKNKKTDQWKHGLCGIVFDVNDLIMLLESRRPPIKNMITVQI